MSTRIAGLLVLFEIISVVHIQRVTGQGIIKCPGQCEWNPCGCCEPNSVNFCQDCHSNGCDQCVGGTTIFKRNFQYFCEKCSDIFGDACLFCQDFNGCGSCKDGYDRVQDPESGMYYCKDKYGVPDPVANCGPTGEVGEDWPATFDPSCVGNPTLYPTDPTKYPTDSPTPRPTPKPTPGPTPGPSPRPTPRPTPKPTPYPTPYPTDDPTPAPTDNPTPAPTDNPTPAPTDNPTPSPTDNPTPAPTDNPTPAPTNPPTNDACDIDFDISIGIIVSNGCRLSNSECGKMKQYITDLTERIFNPNYASVSIFAHNLGDEVITGNREVVIGAISELECGESSFNQVDYDGTLERVLTQLNDASSFDEKKVVMISFCEPEDGNDDDTCSVGDRLNSNGEIEINVLNINIGNNINGNQFECLVNNGGSNSPNYAKYDTFDEANEDITRVEREICEQPTPSPTPMPSPAPTDNPTPAPTDNPTPAPTDDPTPSPTPRPTPRPTRVPSVEPTSRPSQSPTPAPTDEPTPSPTDNPTPAPTDNPTPAPTDNPTPAPTDNPTPSPSNDPTPYPTNNPTPQPTHEVCVDIDYDLSLVIVVSNGCYLTQNECGAIREFLADLSEKVYNEAFVELTIITHDFNGEIISGTRDEVLLKISGLTCNENSNVNLIEYDGSLSQAYNILDGSSDDERKIVFISLCGNEEDDNTCNIPSIRDPNGDIEIIVVNGGEEASNNDQFSCLTPGGINSENYFEFPTIDEDTLISGADDVEDEVCEQPTPSPTASPTKGGPWWTKSPTPKPTWKTWGGSSSSSGKWGGSSSKSGSNSGSNSGSKSESSDGGWSNGSGSSNGKGSSSNGSGSGSSSNGNTWGVESGSSSNNKGSSSGSNKWTTNGGTWTKGVASSSSGKSSSKGSGSSNTWNNGDSTSSNKGSSSGNGSGSGSGSGSSSSGKWNSNPSPTPKPTSWNTNTPRPTNKPTSWNAPSPPPQNSNCGHGGNGEECSNGKIATWDIVQETKCDDLWAQWGSNYYIAGQVCISKTDDNDDDELKITYTTNSGWYLKEVNAWLGCEKDGYPQYSGSYNNYPKLSEFPMRDDDLGYPTTSYSFTTSISESSGCNYLSYCDYCDTTDELLLYVIAQAKVKYYYNGYWYYKTAYLEGDWCFYYNGYWALEHQLLFDVECC